MYIYMYRLCKYNIHTTYSHTNAIFRHCLPERWAKKVPLFANAEYPAPCTNVDVVVRSTPALFSTTYSR